MMRQVLAHYHLPWLACIGLALFMMVFMGALAWVFRKESRGFYAGMSELPLEGISNEK